MRIRLVTGSHLTAIDKRLISAAIQNNWPVAATRTKHMTVTATTDSRYNVTLTETRRDDYGRRTTSLYHSTVEVL